MEERNCKKCIYARTPDNPNDNGCTAWACEFIDRKEAIKIYKAYRDGEIIEKGKGPEKIILKLGTYSTIEDFKRIKKAYEDAIPNAFIIPYTFELIDPAKLAYCPSCGAPLGEKGETNV